MRLSYHNPIRRTITGLLVVGVFYGCVANMLWYLSVVCVSYFMCNPRGAMEARWTSNSKVVGSSPIGGVTEIFLRGSRFSSHWDHRNGLGEIFAYPHHILRAHVLCTTYPYTCSILFLKYDMCMTVHFTLRLGISVFNTWI